MPAQTDTDELVVRDGTPVPDDSTQEAGRSQRCAHVRSRYAKASPGFTRT